MNSRNSKNSSCDRNHVAPGSSEERFGGAPEYPKIVGSSFGRIAVGRETYNRDIYIRVNGKVENRKKSLARNLYGSSHRIGPKELEEVCKGGPEVLFIGTGQSGLAELTEDGRQYLRGRAIECCALPTPQAVEAYNDCERQRAALIHVTC